MTSKYSLFLIIGLVSSAGAFVAPKVRLLSRPTGLFSAVEEEKGVVAHLNDWVRSVDCASKFGHCDVTELHELADKIEAGSDECTFEGKNKDLCDKEIQDRKDVAELLLLQAELQLGIDYLKKANLFAHDVMEEHDMRERDLELEILSEDGI
eukprot:scaffold12976_cov197-Amphora_coffeaeformis.AAC.10